MQPTQTEAPQYNSRRERHEAEAKLKAEALQASYNLLSPEEFAKVRHANEFLSNLRHVNERHIETRETMPEGTKILSLVDVDGKILFNDKFTAGTADRVGGVPVEITNDLQSQQEIIEEYQGRVDDQDWDAIDELDQKWIESQPSKEEVALKAAEYGESLLEPRNDELPKPSKVGQFIALRMFGARQHWLNQQTYFEKMRKYAAPRPEHGRRSARRHYTKAA